MEVMLRRARWLSVLAVCALLVPSTVAAQPPGPRPEDQAEARTRYKKGLELYEEGAFEAALTEFGRAYELAPSYKILYNIALVHLQLNDYAGALRSFKKYLDDGGKKIDAKRRGDVEKEIAKLQSRVASIEIQVNVDGAEVSVDDLEVGQTPLDAPLVVNAGKRKITVQKSGYGTLTKVLVVAGGDRKQLALELKAGAASPPPSAKGAPSPRTDKPGTAAPLAGPTRPVPWLWWGVTGGLAAGTAVAGVLTLGAQRDLDDKKQHPSGKEALEDAAQKTRTLAIVTDVLLVGSVAAGGYATYLTFFKRGDDPAGDRPARVGVGVGPGSVHLVGSF